ncbi:9151_t:CDS:2 [Funneliformis caledonium]|uniref:9151_t:CDS:1 n=1 Tax=Funneliformis caledonium TaxID=1117310 RepID=A0A9N9CGB7_9GLOM|nr:9151_t:CDS:2 [Funneliformis caledonium]
MSRSNRQPVSLFELGENGKLVLISQTLCRREQVVAEISSQLCNWNIQTQQGGGVTASQGGFDFDIDHQTVIRAPDVAFISQNTVL